MRDVEFPFIHDIGGLADLCEEAGVSLPEELVGVDRLTPYEAGLRYDDDQPSIVSRETALSWAAVAVAWARVKRGRALVITSPRARALVKFVEAIAVEVDRIVVEAIATS